eukprot:jgi/Tetstr1/423401/TSEL_014082.t1
MVSLYRARDCLVNFASAYPTDGWDPAEPYVLDSLPLDGSAGFEVITSDASRWAEEVMWHNFRLHYAFTTMRLERWGTSANIRELFFMVPWSIQHIGAQLTGSNILYRLDNTAYVASPPRPPGRELPRLWGDGPRDLYACPSCWCLRCAAAAVLTCENHVSGSGAISSYAELNAICVLFDAELGCRYIHLRVNIDKNVDARHECFAYIPDHVPCLAVRPVYMLEDYLRVFRPAPAGRPPAGRPHVLPRGAQHFHTVLGLQLGLQGCLRARLPRLRHPDDSP